MDLIIDTIIYIIILVKTNKNEFNKYWKVPNSKDDKIILCMVKLYNIKLTRIRLFSHSLSRCLH